MERSMIDILNNETCGTCDLFFNGKCISHGDLERESSDPACINWDSLEDEDE